MNEKEREAIEKISDAAKLLGWDIVFPDKEEVKYIVVSDPSVSSRIHTLLNTEE